MVLISETLPNPPGSDAQGEWVELSNDGSGAVDLSGWYLTTGGTARTRLDGWIVGPGGRVVISRKEAKFVLRNTDGAVFLHERSGAVVSSLEFFGTAPEGKSVVPARGAFSFADPTPGEPNATPHLALIGGERLMRAEGGSLSSKEAGGALLGSAIFLSLLIFFVVRHDAALSNLFFKKN